MATSIKSLDLDAKTYQSPAALERTLKRYIDKVAAFNGRDWGGATINAGDIKGRGLDLALPHGGTPAQQAVIRQVTQYAAQQGVLMNLFYI